MTVRVNDQVGKQSDSGELRPANSFYAVLVSWLVKEIALSKFGQGGVSETPR